MLDLRSKVLKKIEKRRRKRTVGSGVKVSLYSLFLPRQAFDGISMLWSGYDERLFGRG